MAIAAAKASRIGLVVWQAERAAQEAAANEPMISERRSSNSELTSDA
jgi:hypothetical protein